MAFPENKIFANESIENVKLECQQKKIHIIRSWKKHASSYKFWHIVIVNHVIQQLLHQVVQLLFQCPDEDIFVCWMILTNSNIWPQIISNPFNRIQVRETWWQGVEYPHCQDNSAQRKGDQDTIHCLVPSQMHLCLLKRWKQSQAWVGYNPTCAGTRHRIQLDSKPKILLKVNLSPTHFNPNPN